MQYFDFTVLLTIHLSLMVTFKVIIAYNYTVFLYFIVFKELYLVMLYDCIAACNLENEHFTS